MIIKNAVKVCALFIMVSSCGWQEDPLAGKHDDIRKATHPQPPLEKPIAKDSNLLVFDTVISTEVAEGQQLNLELKARVLDPNYDKISFSIENMLAFPGANFDADTGVFTWTPPLGFITGPKDVQKLTLSVVALATSENEEVIPARRNHEVAVFVTRTYLNPQVTLSMPSKTTIREGEYHNFSVKIVDQNASFGADEGPTVEFGPSEKGSASLINFIGLDRVSVDQNKKEWTFHYTLDLKEAEVTNNYVRGGFSIVGRSQHGRRSTSHDWTVNVVTDLARPQITWDRERILTHEKENIIPFIIYDPKAEGRLSLISHGTLPKDANLNCVSSRTSFLECEFSWHPTGDIKDYPRTGGISLRVKSESPVSFDNHSTTADFYVNYRLVEQVPSREGEQ